MPQNFPKGISATMRGGILAVVALGLLGLAVAAFATWFFTCPCERMPGAYLSGEMVQEPVSDWSFANQAGLCQIQVDTRLLPHALNLNCMATDDGKLYLSCAQCDGKYWSTAAIANGTGKIRLDGRVYPVTFTHITDPDEVQRSWAARTRKLQGPDATIGNVQQGWWTFRLESRAQG